MTEQEIEKLREKLGPEYSVKRQNGAVTVELADIWKGVEFAECVSDVKVDRYGKEIAKGQIYRIVDWFKREVIYIDNDELGWQSKHFKPSTESAYVEQLKAKAKELYGEIKNGDRFEFTWIGDVIERSIQLKGKYDFYYDKESDALYLYGFPLYKQGKWAKKVDEPVRVTIYADQTVDGKTQVGMTIKSEFPLNVKDRKEFLNHIEESIESYLNKIP